MTADERRAELRRATLLGVRWISVARAVVETAALASSVVLARLIPPAEFGRAAIALIVVALAIILGPAGLTAVLVQRRELERAHVEAAAFLSIVTGATLTLLTFAFAATAGVSLFGSEIARLLEIAAPAWLISSLGAVSQAMLQRALDFPRIAVLESVSVLLGTGTGIALAVAGLDAGALVAGGLVSASVGTALAVAWWRPPAPRPGRRALAEVSSFAAPVALSSLVYSTFRNIDYAILGVRLSAAQVGYYYRAYQLGVDYQSKLSQIMLRVSFPVYSRAEGLEELRRLRRRIVRTHATAIIPLLAAFVAMAPVGVPWVFGAAWEPAVVPAQIMAGAGIAYAVATGTGPLMIAIGRPGALLTWSVCELLLYAALIVLLAPHGLTAVSIGVAAFATGSLLVIQAFLLRPYAGIPMRQLWDDVSPGLITGAGVLATAAPARGALEGRMPTILLLAVLTSLATVVAAALLRLVFPAVWGDFISIFRRVGSREATAASE